MKSSSAAIRLVEEMATFEDLPIQESLNLALAKYFSPLAVDSFSNFHSSVPELEVRGLDEDKFAAGFAGFIQSSPKQNHYETIAYQYLC